MSSVIHVIVSCTDRKRGKTDDSLKLGRVPSSSAADERVKEWWSRVRGFRGEKLPAKDLYSGELWQLSMEIEPALSRRGADIKVWVASAGLGLLPIDAKIPNYGATFAKAGANSVLRGLPKDVSPSQYRRDWWNAIAKLASVKRGAPRSIAELAAEDPKASFLVVAGPDYIRAMADDLIAAREELASSDRMSIVSNAKLHVPELEPNLIPVDARAQVVLGGTLVGVNARTALELAKRGRAKVLKAPALRKTYAKLVEGVDPPKKKDGTKMPDNEVREFIYALLDEHPGMRATPMLRRLRDQGFACEQKKFSKMHKAALNERATPLLRHVAPRSKKKTTRSSSKKGRLRYFLPDARDMVDPSFDFTRETRSKDRVPGRDDVFAHEVFNKQVIDGMLVSMGVVQGVSSAGKYSQSQRLRLKREGAAEFFRAESHAGPRLEFMGDCGAFSYVKEEEPPFTVEEVIDFYARNEFDYGISVDHVILDYEPRLDERMFGKDAVPDRLRNRQQLTLDLARDFLKKSTDADFTPIGVAQGWSPASYAHSVKQLQKIGYDYIAIGGVVPLKTPKLLDLLGVVDDIRRPKTRLHLLGVTRVEEITRFAEHGVTSFDSTSPLKRAWNDDRANYHTLGKQYMAIRVPQVTDNPKLKRRVATGEVDFEVARAAEQNCLKLLAKYDKGSVSLKRVMQALTDYAEIHDPDGKDRSEQYRETLADKAWKSCKCDVCKAIGHHVVMFRGAERNRRRGFHNVAVFYEKLQLELGKPKRKKRAGRVAGKTPLQLSL